MSRQPMGMIGGLLRRGALQSWRAAARAARKTDISLLRTQRKQARHLRRQLDELLHVAETRLASSGHETIIAPAESDWTWRPELWRGPLSKPGTAPAGSGAQLSDEVTLFHDCGVSDVLLRQIRNTRTADLAPFGLRMDIFRFEGSYLSLVIDLPAAAVSGLTRAFVVRLDSVLELERPLKVLARLNIKNGPNTEQIVGEVAVQSDEQCVEFDLAYSNMNEKRIDKAWMELFFEDPGMNQILLRDATFSRRMRAEI